jgi:hypothetical protein
MLQQYLPALAGYLVALLIGGAWVRQGPPAHRLTAMFVAQVLALVLPFSLPNTLPIVRFFVAALAVLAFIRLWETARGVPADRRSLCSWSHYALYFTGLAEMHFVPDEQSAEVRQSGWLRAARGLLKGLALGALFVFDAVWPVEAFGWPLVTVWNLMAAYTAAAGFVDLVAGLTMAISGYAAAEVFQSPPLATSPSEFWGIRWNSTFRNASYRLIFSYLYRRVPVRVAMALVFVWSALVHEYLVVACLGTTHGHMTAFFVLQAVAVLVHGMVRRRLGRRLPRLGAIGLHWAWMLATAPLFFAPMRQVFFPQ